MTTDAGYLSIDLFPGDEAEVICRSASMVNGRKVHKCFGHDQATHNHEIAVGVRQRVEKGFVDHSFWGEWRVCVPCLDVTIAQLNGDDEDDEA